MSPHRLQTTRWRWRIAETISDWSIESGEEGLRARAMVPPSGTVRGTHIPPGWPHLGRLQVQPGGFWWGGIRHKAMYFTILALNENISISSSVWSRKYVSVRILRTTGVVWYSVSTRLKSRQEQAWVQCADSRCVGGVGGSVIFATGASDCAFDNRSTKRGDGRLVRASVNKDYREKGCHDD
ncbi:hypothetical protein L208DRAFT_1462126 [Tricholoma matsutake]|nr:hypothetical protein L208DRAFT_1462126 [Tricholoma matsutake 945]